ncbi:hypothetical protein Syun_012126 [Stephania yunnanensis]|uniref:Uncharacterized protein n=1 Tax=Stephania yunnanensis TaxID=152371 RepID=A0AAP0JZ28_9MAGN
MYYRSHAALKVLEKENCEENAFVVGSYMKERLTSLKEKYENVGVLSSEKEDSMAMCSNHASSLASPKKMQVNISYFHDYTKIKIISTMIDFMRRKATKGSF